MAGCGHVKGREGPRLQTVMKTAGPASVAIQRRLPELETKPQESGEIRHCAGWPRTWLSSWLSSDPASPTTEQDIHLALHRKSSPPLGALLSCRHFPSTGPLLFSCRSQIWNSLES